MIRRINQILKIILFFYIIINTTGIAMADFQRACEYLLKVEGGYSNHPNDAGGPTNHGISLKFLKYLPDMGDVNKDGKIDGDDIKKLDPNLATQIYKREFWDKYGYGAIQDDIIATKIFDMAVNMGPLNAHRLVQRAYNSIVKPYEALSTDGIWGPKTLKAINGADPNILLKKIINQLNQYYDALVINKPSQIVFLRGWKKRAASYLTVNNSQL